MASNALKLCFEQLESDRDRAIVNMLLVDGTLTNGMDVRRNIL